jgi:two-component system, LytTR family, sensor histidine kinase AlgZ
MIKKPPENPVNDSFLLPNLCEYQALLLLFMASQLLVITFTLFKFGFAIDWVSFGMVTLYVQWQSVFSAVVLCKMRLYLSRLPKHQAVAIAFSLLLAIGLGLAIAVQWYSAPLNYGRFSWNFVLRNLVLSAIVIGVALRYLYVHQKMINREKSALLANLSALQARIKPHFLFNTMNSIASLITIAPDKAEKMVEDLAELLRASLRDDVVETSIADEWWLCERYLEIEQLRLGKRLTWSCDFSGLDVSLNIPHLGLQPIVENAIYHGIQPHPEGGYLHVSGESTADGWVTIRVENSQAKIYQMQRENRGNKMAINNIRHRIQQLYGDSAVLQLEDKEDQFLVTLRYQLRSAKKSSAKKQAKK